MIRWPPHSSDLSPIEMIWSVTKWRLKGWWFQNEEQLFTAMEAA
jgi:transposase